MKDQRLRKSKRRLLLWFIVIVVCLSPVVIIGLYAYRFATQPDVWIYVDNGGRETYTVFLDGDEVAQVPPGQCEVVKCRHGSHQFQVTSGARTLVEETKTLTAPIGAGGINRYVFNPDGNNRYWSRRIEYGPVPPDYVRNLDNSNEDELRRVAARVDLLESKGLWVEAPFVNIGLDEAIPETADAEEWRTLSMLTRLDPAVYAELETERNNRRKRVTEQELEDFTRRVERVIDGD